MYIIWSLSEDGWWSNEEGWVDSLFDATIYSQQERDTFNLPLADIVEWVKFEAANDYQIERDTAEPFTRRDQPYSMIA
jgi:hypothetical protein